MWDSGGGWPLTAFDWTVLANPRQPPLEHLTEVGPIGAMRDVESSNSSMNEERCACALSSFALQAELAGSSDDAAAFGPDRGAGAVTGVHDGLVR